MKKVLCVLLSVLLLTGFVGCAEETPETTAPSTEDLSWQIAGVDIGEYTVIYAEEGKFKAGTNESGRVADVAQELVDGIKELTGVELPVMSEAQADDTIAHEIVVGIASHDAVRKLKKEGAWEREEYSYGCYEGSLVIAGGSANACYFGAMDFLEGWEEFGMGNYEPALVKGSHPLIVVSCIGDSITAGSGKMADGTANDRVKYNYPTFLRRMLGWEYFLCNFGEPGASMTDYTTYGPQYEKSTKLEADVILLMLGTNDADPFWDNFSEDYTEKYFYSLDMLCQVYRKANPEVQIIIFTPPSNVPQGMREACAYMAEHNREYAAENGLQLVDIYNACEEEQWVFNDSIHPQGEVYKRIAEVIYEDIKDTIKKP